MSPCQYREEPVILAQTNGIRGGFVVDVGAADGWKNSNSAFLIDDYGWSGVVIDALPEHVAALHQRYDANERVTVVDCAVSKYESALTFWPGGQGTTALESWHDRLLERGDTVFGDKIVREAKTLTKILDECGTPRVIDFLSVDCEGMDAEVLDSLDWDKYTVNLACVEVRPQNVKMQRFMRDRGLEIVGSTAGNTLYGRKP